MLQLDVQQIISQAVTFLLLLWVLRRLAWRPVLTLLDERRARIQEEFRRIEQGKAELATLQEEYRRHLSRIEAEARVKLQETIQEGDRKSTRLNSSH